MASSSDITNSNVAVAKKTTLRGQLQRNVTEKRSAFCSLVFFSMGGQAIATRMEEVGSVRPWRSIAIVPSGQALINGIIRYGEDIFPVFDLAKSLKVSLQGTAHYCLMAKTPKGDLAIRIDSTIPSMQTVELSAIQATNDPDSPFREVCMVGGREVPVYSFASI